MLRSLRRRGSDLKVFAAHCARHGCGSDRGFKYGADDYLSKPFNLRELLAARPGDLRRGPHLLPQLRPRASKIAGGRRLHHGLRIAHSVVQNRKLELTALSLHCSRSC